MSVTERIELYGRIGCVPMHIVPGIRGFRVRTDGVPARRSVSTTILQLWVAFEVGRHFCPMHCACNMLEEASARQGCWLHVAEVCWVRTNHIVSIKAWNLRYVMLKPVSYHCITPRHQI